MKIQKYIVVYKINGQGPLERTVVQATSCADAELVFHDTHANCEIFIVRKSSIED